MNDAISRLSQKIKQNKKKTVGILRETWASCDKRALVISIGDDKRVSRGQARHNGENLCRQCYYLIRGRSLFYSPGPASACATCAISGRKRRRILCDECRHSFWNTMERERGRKSLYNTWGVVSFTGGKCIMKIYICFGQLNTALEGILICIWSIRGVAKETTSQSDGSRCGVL